MDSNEITKDIIVALIEHNKAYHSIDQDEQTAAKKVAASYKIIYKAVTEATASQDDQ